MSKNPQAVLDVLEFYTENLKSQGEEPAPPSKDSDFPRNRIPERSDSFMYTSERQSVMTSASKEGVNHSASSLAVTFSFFLLKSKENHGFKTSHCPQASSYSWQELGWLVFTFEPFCIITSAQTSANSAWKNDSAAKKEERSPPIYNDWSTNYRKVERNSYSGRPPVYIYQNQKSRTRASLHNLKFDFVELVDLCTWQRITTRTQWLQLNKWI